MSIKPEDAELSIAGVEIKSPPQDLLRYCGDQPGDDWVKRVDRLNGIIDVMRYERGESLTLDDQLRMLAEAE